MLTKTSWRKMGSKEHVDEEELRELADFILETMDGEISSDIDPMIGYIKQLTSHFYTQNSREFKSRFVRGYTLLLEELMSNE